MCGPVLRGDWIFSVVAGNLWKRLPPHPTDLTVSFIRCDLWSRLFRCALYLKPTHVLRENKEAAGLTSNRPMEAEVWLDCISSVRAHICWMLDETACGSGRPWNKSSFNFPSTVTPLNGLQQHKSAQREEERSAPPDQGADPPASGLTANQKPLSLAPGRAETGNDSYSGSTCWLGWRPAAMDPN